MRGGGNAGDGPAVLTHHTGTQWWRLKDNVSKNVGNKVGDVCRRGKQLEEICGGLIPTENKRRKLRMEKISRGKTSREGFGAGRGRPPWALSTPTYSPWVCQNALTTPFLSSVCSS